MTSKNIVWLSFGTVAALAVVAIALAPKKTSEEQALEEEKARNAENEKAKTKGGAWFREAWENNPWGSARRGTP